MSERISILDRFRRRMGWSYSTFNPDYLPPPAMEDDFKRLAEYNAEVHRGVQHSQAYDTEMAAIQARFDDWSAPLASIRPGLSRGRSHERMQGSASQGAGRMVEAAGSGRPPDLPKPR